MKAATAPRARRRQSGVSLLFSLIALVLIGFGAMALLRTVDTGTLIMGNLGFKQDALNATSSGAEQALAWLSPLANTPTLNNDDPTNGYYAAAQDRLDISGNQTSSTYKRPVINWTGDCQGLSSGSYDICDVTPKSGVDVNGNKIQWVITRLCDAVGVPTGGNHCMRPATGSSSGEARERGQLQPGGRITSTLASPYYRILVRAEGPRNTVVYTETLVHY
ncbi:MAG TPA: hypothetical protein VHA82_23755 [Ramlibacter sp.]|uniref:pilus assembly PilX family protein n=1 Tax=Ramlibacter sp. TaxID=1917967 RepID=UPI002BD7F650|nr:hypothetical protein [Ramlibacter sp.]HVZ46843.1 hypothetical protein [Ramlibacter sp.]